MASPSGVLCRWGGSEWSGRRAALRLRGRRVNERNADVAAIARYRRALESLPETRKMGSSGSPIITSPFNLITSEIRLFRLPWCEWPEIAPYEWATRFRRIVPARRRLHPNKPVRGARRRRRALRYGMPRADRRCTSTQPDRQRQRHKRLQYVCRRTTKTWS